MTFYQHYLDPDILKMCCRWGRGALTEVKWNRIDSALQFGALYPFERVIGQLVTLNNWPVSYQFIYVFVKDIAKT